MKKTLLVLIVLIYTLAGCKLDEAGFKQNSTNNDGAVITGNLVGMWFWRQQITTGTAFGVPINSNITSFTPNDYFMFNSDNTVKMSSKDDGVVSGNYVFDAVAKTVTISNSNTNDGVYTVKKLTADSLVLYISISIPELATTTNGTLKFSH
ncbi:MAG TPA: hypothetical protein VL490_06995 [Mucilaginibacter sp.]|jgi:hypothetical protein|nr:hypothetical protein [Mucilaginibacter sp.]